MSDFWADFDATIKKAGSENEQVDHPTHYLAGGIEVIDIIEAYGLGFHAGNSVKYILRSGRKTDSPLVDLKKARWYLDRLIQRIEAVSKAKEKT